jgi:GTP cyclohydrolase I
VATINPRRVERGIISVLEGLGYTNWRTEQNLKGTPKRVARMLVEMCTNGGEETLDREVFSAIFSTPNNQMLVIKDVYVTGMCPHHILPVQYKAAVAYVPKKRVIGLSKIPRLLELVCRSLDLQETLTDRVADLLMEKLQPRGVMVVLEGVHGCLTFRGVKQRHAVTTTSAVRGVFRDPAEQARLEFLALLRGGPQ